MNVFITGATGFIGYHVARLLREQGARVRALVRNPDAAPYLHALGVEPVRGDIRDIDTVLPAVQGCEQLYHIAADYRLWVPNPATMYAINVTGTENVMRAARDAGVARVVYTSSVGTLAAGVPGAGADEHTPSSLAQMVGHYKRSKFIAEQRVQTLAREGLPVVIVNPSTPVGPEDRKPTPTGRMIVDFLCGRIPAFLDTGLNFVDVSDVAAGHLLAARKGIIGERYILGNRNMTLKDFFALLAGLTGRTAPRIRLPYTPVLLAAYVDELVARMIPGREPRAPVTGVRMARKYMFFDSSTAVQQLGMPQSPLEPALLRAAQWFAEHRYL